MAGTVAELKISYQDLADNVGREVAHFWDTWNNQRAQKVEEWLELRNYIFATDTSTTSNSTNPWKNKTTVPKLCQIRDNLHSNYISSLFPNDNWMKWEGYTAEDEVKAKKTAIAAYMQNKLIESGFRDTVSQLVLDYIDYGNCFGMIKYEGDYYEDDEGEWITGYVGPRLVRISPLDIVFNPMSVSFAKSPKIVRKLITAGEMAKLAEEDEEWAAALNKAEQLRALGSGFSREDFSKAVAFQVDGFGSMLEYLGSTYIEVLTFYGDLYDKDSGTLMTNKQITVIDRSFVVSNKKIDNWLGGASIVHTGWRKRPDNLYQMGPLDNLVGMQYRIDHLENLKADAQDLAIHPPLKIIGDVDPFTWMPGGKIFIPNDGDVLEMGKNLSSVISAENAIAVIMDRMEEMAGAPRQAMGIRTPGEKTAYEVQSLDNAAGRIFQEKVINFETNFLEPVLNAMLASARKNLDVVEVARVMDEDLGVDDFLEITKEDITARGKLRPVGARHFAQQAQLLQNLNNTLQGSIGQMISQHISGKKLAELVEDNLQIDRYEMVRPNVGLMEQLESQKLMEAGMENNAVEGATPTAGGM